MKISDLVEPLVREALAAAVKRDWERFLRALEAFPDEQTGADALALATAISAYVLQDQYGRKPTDEEIGRIAAKMDEKESWSGLNEPEFRSGLRAVLGDDSGDGQRLEPQARIALPFVMAAYLLASSAKPPEWWFNYLDRVEAALDRP